MGRFLAPFDIDPRRLALTLAIGAAGGAAFALARLPLAWMLGAMCATTACAVAGMRIAVPVPLRALMIAVLGVMLGSAFRPEMFARAGEWGISLSALIVLVAASALLGSFYFRRLARYDRTTAYFSAVPGGLSEMILVGGSLGGDDRTIALTHAARILLVVLIIPFWFRLFEGYMPPAAGVIRGFHSIVEIAPVELFTLAASGVVGFFAARAARLPSAALTGPMALSAAAHLGGITASRPPVELIIVAQVVVGSAIGCRFAGVSPRRILAAIAVAAGSTALMLSLTLGLALAVNAATGIETEALVLAYAPGGLAEMSLIALALGIDPALVSTHHVARILLVVVLAPLAYRAFARRFPEKRKRANP